MNNNEIKIIGKILEKLKTGTDGENRRIRLEIRPGGHGLFAQVYEPELIDIVDRLEVGDTIEGTGRVDIFDGRKKKGQPKVMIEVVFDTLKKADDFAPVAGWKLVGEIAGDRMETFVRHRDGMDLTFSLIVETRNHSEKLYPVLIANRRDIVRYVENTFEAGSRVAIYGTPGKYRTKSGIWLPCMIARQITYACMEGD